VRMHRQGFCIQSRVADIVGPRGAFAETPVS
jgi:hypothetical protein